jgi:2-polyprenyl-6-methoxyphenol hydroxylase-like FAD-dependent oxidoreductase
MKKDSRILIHGAGVAGLGCAIWLGRHGFHPVVIEKASEIRATGGFVICLSGASYRFADELGMMSALKKRDTDIYSASYHNSKGDALLRLDYKKLFKGVDFIQITRDEIENVFYENAKNLAEYRFNISASKIEQNDEKKVQVEFTDGTQEEFDVVIGTDGLYSTVRELAFDPEDITEHHLGLQVAAFKLDNIVGLKNKFEYHMDRNRYMVLYTNRDGNLGAIFLWKSENRKAPSIESRWDVLKENYKDAAPLFNNIIEHFPDTSPMYMDPLIQVEMKKWHTGRVVLLGDAAHCMTLLSGQGASSAFVDSSYLCKSLIENDYEIAFNDFERKMRPSISIMQPATREGAKWYIPQTRIRHFIRDNAMRFLPDSYFMHHFKKKYSRI